MSCYSEEELQGLGFKHVGVDVRISRKASFYGIENIAIDDGSRIDDFCVLSAGSGGISVGKHVHVAVNCSLIGAARITLSDYCNLSSRVAIYSSSDDYSGAYMTNPTIPKEFTNVTDADVFLGTHVIVGCGSVILPGLTLADGVAVGALSLVNQNCSEFGIYAGCPATRIKDRQKNLLALQKEFESGAAGN